MTSNLTLCRRCEDVVVLRIWPKKGPCHVISRKQIISSTSPLQGYCSTNCNAEERRQAQCIMKAKTKKHLENNILWVNVKTRTLLT